MRLQRFREPFLPIHPPSKGERLVISMERLIKGMLFNCSMCGNCLLQETAFICPLLCPKGLRNGPCGSGSHDQCCVDPSRPCVWHLIYERAEALGRQEQLLEVQAPLDWSRVGHETWLTAINNARDRGLISLTGAIRDPGWRERVKIALLDLRQPEWWQGDDHYHPADPSAPVSRFQTFLERGVFVVTAEVAPPAGANTFSVQEKGMRLQGLVNAANVTQNPMATPRMSSLACCVMLEQCGVEPVLQLTGRDYNRYALQSEALGAAALGIHNILCLTGDAPSVGHDPVGKLPFDLDATQMIWILRRMRDEGRFLDGRLVSDPPKLFIGAAGSPNDPDPRHEALRLEKKINAGAQFIQTQLVYDLEALERWLEALDRRNLLSKVHVLVGIGPLRSLKVARFLRERIPDIVVPLPIIERLKQSLNPEEAGFEIALELIQNVKSIPGVNGVHIMSLGWETILPRLLNEITPSEDI